MRKKSKIYMPEDLSKEELDLLNIIRDKNLTNKELSEVVKGFKEPNKTPIKEYNLETGTDFMFALLGDPHFGNKSTNKKALHSFYDFAYDLGVRHFFNCGDFIDGSPNMHKGIIYEQYAIGFSSQSKDVVANYPFKEDAITFYITGNHDQSFKKDNGARLEDVLATQRQDLVFLGEDQADVKFGNGSKLRLIHPGGGCSYALSYKPQKLIESISGGDKPNILAIGHYHKAAQFFYRNIFAFMVGTFERQTPFMRQNSLAAHVGAWIIQGKSGKEGGIKYITSTFVPYMK